MEDPIKEYNGINKDVTKMYSDLCIPLNQPDSIPVQVTIQNNTILSTNFDLSDTIFEIKHYILPLLQPKIKNIQQIKCIMYYGNQQFEANDHVILKSFWNNCPIQILVRIEHPNLDNENILDATQHNTIHPEHGKVLDTNATMPMHVTGYLNQKTSKLYKNTMMQTVYETTDLNSQNNKNKISLAIQTTQTQSVTTEVVKEIGNQTITINFLQSLNIMKEITPGYQYITSHKPHLDENDTFTRVIVKAIRIWTTKRKFEHMLKYYHELQQITYNEEENIKYITYTEHQKSIINLQFPTKTRDFEALYSVIQNRYKDIKIKTSKSVKNKIQLKEEFNCLKEITKQKNQAKKIAEDRKIFKQLNEASKSINVTKRNGETISTETPETYRAKCFMEFFIALKKNDLSKTERIELLLKLKETLEHFQETDLTRPIIKLITRELTMLNTVQLKDDQLKILRQRIENEFRLIIKQPSINPAIARTPTSINLIKCYNCKKLKSLNFFIVKLNLKMTTTCKDCRHLHRITTERINLTPHENILKNIRATEVQLYSKSSIAFVLSAEDIYYLVTIIWKGKSAISESKDLIQLRLVRWCNKLDWSPSNTILLTIEEAYRHSKIRNINNVYTLKFIDDVHFKHMHANKYFKGLIAKSIECNRNVERRKYV